MVALLIVPGNITSVMMLDYFPGHPLPDTKYTITVVAINEGGRGTSNTPTSKCISVIMYMQLGKLTYGCIVDSDVF